MEADLKSHLTTCAAAYASARSLEMVTVARLATGDWRFFERLETGASFTARKYDSIMRWFSDNWPAPAPWPEAVPRPQLEDATVAPSESDVIRNEGGGFR